MIKKIKDDGIQKNDEIVYGEWVSAGRFVKGMMLFVCLLFISVGIIIYASNPKELAFLAIIFGAASILIFLLYWNYRGLKITLTNDQLEVVYGIFNQKKIPLNTITSCDITQANFRTYGGVGIRFGTDGSWAYNTDFGEAVKLTFQDGRPFVFSTRNPQKICDLIIQLSNNT